MEASQLKISPEHLRFKPISHARKLQLQRENIKALILSKPAGTVIRRAEFAAAAATKVELADSMLNTMIKKGEVVKIPSEKYKTRYSYAVVGKDVVTVKKKPAPKSEPVEKFDLAYVTHKAKEFAWQEDSDSLRAFIKWLGGKHNG